MAVLYLAERLLHYENFKNFEGYTMEQVDVSGTITKSDDTVQVRNKDQLILLDFWTTTCGVCFEKFPDLQKVYDEHKDDDRVAIYSVNVKVRRDTIPQLAETMISERNYTFPVYFANEGIDTQFNVWAYPTAILIKNDTIIGRGGIENMSRILKEQLR